MKDNLRFIVGLLFIIVVFSVSVQPVLAHHRAEVLGEATVSSQLNFPPVTSGPGYILPDSPLFFLDQLKQAVRVAVASTPQQQLAVHKNIAGERFAELRIMVAKDNQAGINTSLFSMTTEMNMAATALSETKAKGGDVKKEAVDLNETIKMQRNTLSTLIDQSSGSLQLRLKAARTALQEAKIEVEDSLPEDELWKEIDETLSTNVSENIAEAKDLSAKLQADLDRLNIMASEAAQRSLTRRNEALQKAIDEKSSQLVVEQRRMLDAEKKKQDALLSAERSYTTEARKAIGDTMRAAGNLQKAQQVIEQIKQ